MREIVSPLVGFRSPFLNNRGLGGFNLLTPALITATRAGATATYFDSNGVLQVAAANTLRLDHTPATGAFRGLLVEPAATNLFTYSENLSNAVWAKTSGTVSENTATAPDGNSTADLFTVTAAATGFVSRTISTTSGVPETFSYFVKSNGFETIAALVINTPFGGTGGNRSIIYNFSTGVATATHPAEMFGSMEPVGNDLWRITFTIVPTASVSVSPQIFRSKSVGDGVKGLWMWGMQRETAGLASSYVPATAASDVTRNADNCLISGAAFSSIWNATENTVYVEFEPRELTPATARHIFDISDGTASNRIQVYMAATTGNVVFQMTTGGSLVVSQTLGAPVAGVNKVAIALKGDDCTGALNGVVQSTDTSCALPVVNRMMIGANISFTSTTLLSGWVKSARFISRRLSNTSLSILTD